MANLQKTFNKNYVSSLKDEVKAGTSIAKYAQETFEYDETQVRYLANVYQPEGLLERMMACESDFKAAVCLYEAYKNISPLLASADAFWVYLTHTELFPYCQKRWENVMRDDVSKDYVLSHWFIDTKGLLRNALASLWWSVYFSIDETNEDNPYELTEILFRDYSFRVNWFSIFLRMKNGLLGVLKFIKDNEDLFSSHFRIRSRYLAQYINRMGAVRNLSYLTREQFYAECEKIKGNIAYVENEDDLNEILGCART